MRKRKKLVEQIGEWWNQLPPHVFSRVWRSALAEKLYTLDFDYVAYSYELDANAMRKRTALFVRRHAFEVLVKPLSNDSQVRIAEVLGVNQGNVSRWTASLARDDFRSIPDFDLLVSPIVYHFRREIGVFLPAAELVRYNMFLLRMSRALALLRFPKAVEGFPHLRACRFLMRLVGNHHFTSGDISRLIQCAVAQDESIDIRDVLDRFEMSLDGSEYDQVVSRSDWNFVISKFLLAFVLVHIGAKESWL